MYSDQMLPQNEKKTNLDVLVNICGQKYAINSEHIISIISMQEYSPIPGAPKEILGVMNFRGNATPIIDLRTLFNRPTIKEEFEQFKMMIDERKSDHVNWIEKLEESVDTGEEFTLATDPHKCAFGKWFYSFKTENLTVQHHLRKIEEPHRKLHEVALEIQTCKQHENESDRMGCMHQRLERAKDEYMRQILGLLDETKDVFQSLYREMLLVLEIDQRQMAAVIDEVLSVEELLQVSSSCNTLSFLHSDYICNVMRQKNSDELILELNAEKLFESATILSEEL
jgi:chemotaxis signal transduction protein